ncbi:MAG: T9SS type A sorting domain-containing protein [Lewinellaceae bacterium]|nr:T9SS type A sorting domain-containing protein [Lewinellaceae bacterium]
MKMYKIIGVVICLICFQHLNAQNYYITAPEGFGAATTGGGTATPVIVTTYADLKSKISESAPAVIIVSGTITIPGGGMISEVVTDKTILGLPGAKLINTTLTQSGSGILNLKNGSSNVIIRNLTFEGPGAYDVDGRDNLTADGCINLWVDHCEFQDGLDGNFDNKGNTDSVTISWCKFTYLKPAIPGGSGGSNDHRFSNLVGSSSSNAPADGHYSITFQNCYWADGCKERMPRARNAELHMLNCYYNTNVSSSTALGLGGGINNLTCYVDHTHFDKIGTVYKNYNSSDGGTIALTFFGCLNGVADVGAVSPPSYSYSVLPVEDVKKYIANPSCGAGATLDVTTAGIISTPCGSVGIKDSEIKPGIKLYPTIIDDYLNIELPDNSTESVYISIYASNGKKIISDTRNITTEKKIRFDVSSLSSGIYFCNILFGNSSATQRIIKQ